MNTKPVLGILGGMGPKATTYFVDKVLSYDPANTDQNYLRHVVYNDPTIPDRNKAILEAGRSPLPKLKRNAEKLQDFGVDVIAMPCNTAHYYYDSLSESVNVPIINMVETCREQVEKEGLSSVGILCTKTVKEVGIYDRVFRSYEGKIIYPTDQSGLMDAIYSVKSSNVEKARNIISDIIEVLWGRGADGIIVACSDLSVLDIETRIQIIDATKTLAKYCVKTLKNNNKARLSA